MSWTAHRETFICSTDGATARARRYLALARKAPRCPFCGVPMQIKDVRGITPKALDALMHARDQQRAALSRKDQP